ncbi:MAG TPA: sigma-70 family RNA polymerase sigma factor [Acidimicrobiales bacterium]
MSDRDLLAQRFESQREHLRAVALRMLGSGYEADDAVQEAWLRLSRSDSDAIDNLAGWLTTVVARVCLDMLRARSAKTEVPPEEVPDRATINSPEDEALLADSVGLALLVVLDSLAPAERLAFVLHDMFAVSFEEIAPIVGRTPVASRQLASRARRRVQSDPSFPDASASAQREVVAAFLAAARAGDFAALLRLLDPDIILRADTVAVDLAVARANAGAPDLSKEMRGVDAVARVFAGGAKAAKLALVNGTAGAVVSVGGRPMAVFDFTVRRGRVVGIELVADPETIGLLDLQSVRSPHEETGISKHRESGLPSSGCTRPTTLD